MMEPSPSVADWEHGKNGKASYRGHQRHNPTVGVGMLEYQPEQPGVFEGELSTQHYISQEPAMEVDHTFDIFS